MRSSRLPWYRNKRGNTFVEAALVMSVFIMVLIGIVDVGQVLVLHQGLVERTRAGARYGVVRQFDPTAIRNVVLYNSATPPSGAKPLLNLTPDNVIVNSYNANSPEARIEVRIENYQFRFFTPLIKGTYVARPIVCSMPMEDQSASAF